MTEAKNSARVVVFDVARFLTSEEAVAEYTSAAPETGDHGFLRIAQEDASRALYLLLHPDCPDPK